MRTQPRVNARRLAVVPPLHVCGTGESLGGGGSTIKQRTDVAASPFYFPLLALHRTRFRSIADVS